MAKQLLILSTICFSSFVLLAGVNGAESSFSIGGESTSSIGRPKRELVDNMEINRLKTSGSEAKQFGEKNAERRGNVMDPAKAIEELTLVKRAPNGFTGMRGKKQYEFTDLSPNSLDWLGDRDNNDNDNNDEDDDDEEEELGSDSNRLPNAWGGRRFKKAPSAFYGVRGKKFGAGGSNNFININDLMRKLEEDHVREMLLQDFIDRMAVRTEYDGVNEIEKRTPSGFVGMRGKRTPAEMQLQLDAENSVEKRSPGNAFVGVRGKKETSDGHRAFKRSPMQQAAFYGTRGKKQPFVDFRNKFVGVRGKKSFTNLADDVDQSAEMMMAEEEEGGEESNNNNNNNNYYGQQPRYLVDILPLFLGTSDKRAPSGFLGMRGKRATTTKTDAHPGLEEASN